MKNYFNRILKIFFLKLGIHISPATSEKKLDEFVKKLYPIHSGIELIRLGSHGNGGYLLPDDLEGIEACFSPGVGSVSDFEEQCLNLGMKVFLADKSVDGPALSSDGLKFEKKFIGASVSDDFLTLEAWLKNSNLSDNSDIMLQMDIEGYEYEVLYSVPDEYLDRCRIVIIEFHKMDLLWNKNFFNLFSGVFDKILKSHECVHIHPNNCCESVKRGEIEIPPVMEFTFLRKDRFKKRDYASSFPHPLDEDCVNKKPLKLPACWYQNN